MSLSAPASRRLVTWGLLRALLTTAVLVALYYLSPLDHVDAVPLPVSLIVLLLVLVGVCVWQVRAITRAAYPGIRAIEALAATVPLFLLLFAATYYLMSLDDPANFSQEPLTRTDTLYLTITIFSTVGFGDISAASQTARLLASLQMLLDLLVLGLGIRVFTGAVQRGREKATTDPSQSQPNSPDTLADTDGGNAT
jgi:voltage-gated potassium channel